MPGTVLLFNLDHAASAQDAHGTGDVLLVPTPSNDADDPLNWSSGRKRMHLVCLIV